VTGNLIVYAAAGAAVLAFIGGLAGKYAVAPIRRRVKARDRFYDTWNGEPARDGLTARPGVVDRLIRIESELRPNGGGSIKDAVTRIERKVDAHITASQERDRVAAAAVREAVETARRAADKAEAARITALDLRDRHVVDADRAHTERADLAAAVGEIRPKLTVQELIDQEDQSDTRQRS
jgi:hypothetical protein